MPKCSAESSCMQSMILISAYTCHSYVHYIKGMHDWNALRLVQTILAASKNKYY